MQKLSEPGGNGATILVTILVESIVAGVVGWNPLRFIEFI